MSVIKRNCYSYENGKVTEQMWRWKAKRTCSNGYPFEGVNRSLSVRHPFARLKKSVQSVRQTVRTVCISVRNTLASVRSIAISVRQLEVYVRRTAASVRTVWLLFIRWKGENCTRSFSTDTQYSDQNVILTHDDNHLSWVVSENDYKLYVLNKQTVAKTSFLSRKIENKGLEIENNDRWNENNT